jgi:hypothetical protein
MSVIKLNKIKSGDLSNSDSRVRLNYYTNESSQTTTANFISDVNKNAKIDLLYFIDIFLSVLVITPIVIVNWASTWDIAYLYIFNDKNQFYLSILTTLLSSSIIILFFYIFQYNLQNCHDELREKIRNNDKGLCAYYGIDYLFRCFFTYILTTAYVFKWRSYWDLTSHFTANTEWYYFFGLTVAALVCFRLVLNRSFETFARTVPFYLLTDKHFLDHYFLQPKVTMAKNVTILI